MPPAALLRALLPVLAACLLAACTAPARLGERSDALVRGHVFVVTGASSGLGRGVAEKLGAHGGLVVLAARRGAVLDEVAARIAATGGQALAVPTDVSRPEDIERLAAAALARFGRIDAWINNAAVAALGRFEDVPVADHARIVDVNLKGTMFGTHAALRQFRRQGYGSLVNVASVEGRIPLPYHASYAATKAAILALGTALNEELRLAGASRIHVSSVLPWAVDTPFWDHTGNYTGGTPRIYTMDDPAGTVDTIVWVAIHPTKEWAVGVKAQASVIGAQLWPGLAERIAGNLVHRSQITTAPPAPDTAGSVFQPIPQGTAVQGTTRLRMQQEDRARQ